MDGHKAICVGQSNTRAHLKARIVALDLRGHGMSDAPMQMDHYTDGDKWADDIAAVIDELALDRPILVGWSYGGYIISDYVRRNGQGRIAGINFVNAAVVLGPKAFGPLLGPGFLENAPGACQDDLPINIAAIRKFLRGPPSARGRVNSNWLRHFW